MPRLASAARARCWGNGKFLQASGAAGWLVFDDRDGDGVHDANETSALTDVDGNFSLSVAPGTHTIRLVRQDHYVPSRRLRTSYTITVISADEIGGAMFGQRPI